MHVDTDDPPTRVLIVDDTPDVRELLQRALERTDGFHVVATADNGRTGVDAATRTRPDLVLLDLTMPVMDGLEAAPLIRDACPDATLIMISAFAESRMGAPALAAGAHCYVEKGGSLRVLIEGIQQCLDTCPG